MKILILSFVLTFYLGSYLNANTIECKKFDIKCKTKNYLKNTKEFQKKSWSKSILKKDNETKK